MCPNILTLRRLCSVHPRGLPYTGASQTILIVPLRDMAHEDFRVVCVKAWKTVNIVLRNLKDV